MNNARQEIQQAIGEASMCWNPTPEGVFDSVRAAEISEELLKRLKRLGLRDEESEQDLELGERVEGSWSPGEEQVSP